MSSRPDAAPDLRARALDWRDDDPDATTRARMDELLAADDAAALADHVGRRLRFGTAGLRAALGTGPNRMNRLVVRQTAAGLARALAELAPEGTGRGVVVGHDARHGSAGFSADVAEVFVSHGLDVHLLDGPAPTPLAAFAVRHLGAAAGVVVTASHNPPGDNGIKVFWSDGAQIVPPIDAAIAAAIDEVAGSPDPSVRRGGPVAATQRGTVHRHTVPTLDAARDRAGRAAGGAAVGTGGGALPAAYVRAALDLVPGPPAGPVPLAVTALHGVGSALLEEVLAAGGHGPLHVVASQRRPDPDFPGLPFPNPEEPGVLHEVVALARRVGAAAALAVDPDADRLALAVPDGAGRWSALSGDELGAVLCHHLLGVTAGTPDRLVATTVVSSGLVPAMCAAAGVHHAETLTGFKWLCRPGIEHPGWTQVLAYEEALGYAVGPDARDKDGITAALVAADLVARLVAEGRTVGDLLDDLARAHGSHVTANGSHWLEGPGWADRLAALVDRVVTAPPERLGGRAVLRSDRPAADVVRWWLDDGTRVVLRPSGTEPKVKHYCEAVEPVGPAPDTPAAARDRARDRLRPVVTDLARLVTP